MALRDDLRVACASADASAALTRLASGITTLGDGSVTVAVADLPSGFEARLRALLAEAAAVVHDRARAEAKAAADRANPSPGGGRP